MTAQTMLRDSQGCPKYRARRSAPKMVPLPGALFLEQKRCNRPNCRCVAGGAALHGPYLYRRWVEDDRRRRQKIPAADADRIRSGLAE